MSNQTENRMGTTPVLKLIFMMSVPAMFSMLIQSLYNIVDSYYVAKISESALTAVSLAFPVQMLLTSFGVGTGVGINSLVSRRLGERNQKAADSAAAHGLIFAGLTYVLFAIFGLFFTEMFFRSFHPTEEVLQMGSQYLSIVCTFSFGVFIEMVLEKTLQATGNMIFPMLFQLTGCVINIILDPIMIFGLLGFPKLGIAGAAIATVIAQICAMFFAMIVCFKMSHKVRFSLKGFRFSKATAKDVYKVAVPSILMQSIGSFMTIGLNAILIKFSDAAVSVLGIYFKLQSFVFMPVFGLTQGVMPIMGYNYGAGKKKRLMDTLKYALLIALCIMCLGTLLFWLFPKQLLMIFNASQEMLDIGISALKIISLCFPAAALGITFSTMFQALGYGTYSLGVSLLRQLVIILPVAYLLSLSGLDGIWYSFPIAEGLAFFVSIFLMVRLYNKRVKGMEPLASLGQAGL